MWVYMTKFKFRFAGVGIGKFLKGWCCRKNEGSGTMGTLSGLGSEQREGSVQWEWSCGINGFNLTVFSPLPAAAGSRYRLITSDKTTVRYLASTKRQSDKGGD